MNTTKSMLSNENLKLSNYQNKKEADKWDTNDVRKGKMIFYREELNKQLDYKKKITDHKKNLENISTAEYMNHSIKDIENESVIREVACKVSKQAMESRNSYLNCRQEKNQRRTSDNLSKKSNITRLKEDLLKKELDSHLKKNKHQKDLLTSLNKQIESKREENRSKAGSIKSSNRTNSVIRGSVKNR